MSDNKSGRAGRMARSKADGVLDRIGQQVVAGRFPPGQRVPTEEELVRKLGISRPSVREALKALVRKGLVE
jgi:DNA-binding FadR family transcriptional regulator